MNEEFDVVIVGAGAAGLTLAKELDGALKVLLIEKKKEPHKHIACAEWVPPVFPVSPVAATYAMVTEYDGNTLTKDFQGKIIDRESWQKGMLDSLSATTVHLGEGVTQICGSQIKTSKRAYKAALIVGADGPLSVVRKSFGLPIAPLLPAINARVRAKGPLESTFVYFMPEIEKGYGWYFPKGELANVGVGAMCNLKVSLDFFLRHLASIGMIETKILDLAAGFIPLYGLSPMASENAALIGDAAGLTDPLTGAGIHQAWDSALELAKTIKENLGVSDYAKRIQKTYGSFLPRRHGRRAVLEDKWANFKEAVEGSWISFK